MARQKPDVWGCEHRYPIEVAPTGNGEQQRARCLGCGVLGPERENVEQAMLALRDQARYKQSLEA